MNPRYVNNRSELLDFIVDFKQQHNGIAPTKREIQVALDISSTSVVAYHLDQLEEAGLITYPLGRGVARAIAVPGYEFRETNEQPEETT